LNGLPFFCLSSGYVRGAVDDINLAQQIMLAYMQAYSTYYQLRPQSGAPRIQSTSLVVWGTLNERGVEPILE
jgi:hypothetical protein